jgi:hypothetical protein
MIDFVARAAAIAFEAVTAIPVAVADAQPFSGIALALAGAAALVARAGRRPAD